MILATFALHSRSDASRSVEPATFANAEETELDARAVEVAAACEDGITG